MELHPFGSLFPVSTLTLGGGGLGMLWGPTTPEECVATVHAAVAAGINLLSPFVPLLFMGEEYGETAPFQYFTSHGDPALVEAVRRGRHEEFAAFGWEQKVPDPQDEQTYKRSHLDHSLRERGKHQTLLRFYQQLIRIRREFNLGSATSRAVRPLGDHAVLLLFESNPRRLAIIFNFAKFPVTLDAPELEGNWTALLDSGTGTKSARLRRMA